MLAGNTFAKIKTEIRVWPCSESLNNAAVNSYSRTPSLFIAVTLQANTSILSDGLKDMK